MYSEQKHFSSYSGNMFGIITVAYIRLNFSVIHVIFLISKPTLIEKKLQFNLTTFISTILMMFKGKEISLPIHLYKSTNLTIREWMNMQYEI